MKTGMNTGLSDYILQHAPFAASMANAKYDEYYRSERLLFSYVIWIIIHIAFFIRSPWATSTELELQHKNLFKEIGSSLQGNHHE